MPHSRKVSGTPRNSFINAGAIAVADRRLSLGRSDADLTATLSDLAGAAIDIDEEVTASEAETGFCNQALANFMKRFGKLDNDVAAVLRVLPPVRHPHELPATGARRQLPVPRQHTFHWGEGNPRQAGPSPCEKLVAIPTAHAAHANHGSGIC
jgi:hypothetical protein